MSAVLPSMVPARHRDVSQAGLGPLPPSGIMLNDEQSQLNATRVHHVFQPRTIDDIADAICVSKRTGRPISVAGGRHSMGGQQFGTDALHLDLTSFRRVLHLDADRGLVTVEAGIQWPELISELHRLQPGEDRPWTIREKQTGVDAVTIGGSLASNIHGRGLASPPFASDIESFNLLDADGRLHSCSRTENAELFSLAIGGYGLFGIVCHVTLRLTRRFKVRRRVEIIEVKDLLDAYRRCVDAGFVFGDCQYAVDLNCEPEHHCGVFACYEPVPLETPVDSSNRQLSAEDWARLYMLIRTDKPRAFAEYAAHYQRTDGQVYWSDTHQLAGEFVGHRSAVDATKGTEMITEVYLSHENVMPFFAASRADLAATNADISYGTVRFIEEDTDTFLCWATERSVCIVCNLHVKHTPDGIERAKSDFRQIIDRALEFGGRFYLTYHRWATPGQVAASYPQIGDFFRLKGKFDPQERFQSDWYRQYAPCFR
jgi:FAD/FMN-containing dehydrogenase